MLKRSLCFLSVMLLVLSSCAAKKTTSASAVGRFCPVKKEIIVIDAGHGGRDFGAHSDQPPLYVEKVLTLSTARLVEQNLRRLGYQTLMTRQKDSFVELTDRAKFANSCGADLFVSIHYNSAPKERANGIEVYFYRSGKDKQRESHSKILAQSVLDELIESTKAHSRGVKQGNFAVIRETKMPAILVEGGFLTNLDELKKIRTIGYQRKIALAVVAGIEKYLREEKRRRGRG